MRNRSRVTGAPVLLINVRRISIVPLVPFASEIKSRVRLGADEDDAKGSRRMTPNCELRLIGLARFSGPGAPRLAPIPVKLPVVLISMKSERLSPVSFGKPPVVLDINRKKV